jgi:hypothetical protein
MEAHLQDITSWMANLFVDGKRGEIANESGLFSLI